jgi:hypothetical protein
MQREHFVLLIQEEMVKEDQLRTKETKTEINKGGE